jgi:hypothetical protein
MIPCLNGEEFNRLFFTIIEKRAGSQCYNPLWNFKKRRRAEFDVTTIGCQYGPHSCLKHTTGRMTIG